MRTCDSSDGIGGRMIYVGELDRAGARLVRAGNIAGAASLSATSDPTAQRLAIREGVVDFLVTSADEALRILKNEIRKRNAVSVCIAASPAQVTAELNERGVQPDMLREASGDFAVFAAQGAQIVEAQPVPADQRLVILPQPIDATAQRILDSITDSIPETDHAARRWLRLSPRYLGPQARKIRSFCCDRVRANELEAASWNSFRP
jgi:hypothetical protein